MTYVDCAVDILSSGCRYVGNVDIIAARQERRRLKVRIRRPPVLRDK